jgi:hypothetical protein
MNRFLIRATTALAAVSAAALFVPATASAAPVSKDECAEISTGNQPNGWENTFGDEGGQAGKHSEITITDDDGSLELTTVETKNRAASYHSAGQLPLDDLTGPLTFEQQGAPAHWQIRVSGAATIAPEAENGFATLVWSGDSSQDAFSSDQWWATRPLPGLERGQKTTLAALTTAAGAETVIDHYGVSVEGPVGTKGNIDNVTFNGCTTNFKYVGSSEEDDAFGSLGGLGLADLIPLP